MEALKQNELAANSRLIIFSDGPKENSTEEELNKVKEIRNLVKEEKWCGAVKIIERTENLGLAESVILGVTELIEEYGRVIVLEDDIIVGKYFLNFINEALELYKFKKRVFGVSGYQFTPSKEIKESTYFLPIMSSWGYATWADRWSQINFNGEELLEIVENKKIGNKLNFGSINYLKMLKDQVDNLNNSWAVRFYVSMYLKNGLFLYPNKSLLRNIGFDGTGIHSGSNPSKHYRDPKEINSLIPVQNKKVKWNKKNVDLSMKGTYNSSVSKNSGFKTTLKNILPPELIQYARRKLKRDNSLDIDKTSPRYTRKIIQFEDQEIIVPDVASFNFMKKEIFENEVYKFSTHELSPYIIDGGANIGLSTIYFKKLFPNSKIIGFEPDPSIFEILKKNIRKFNFQNIELVNKGLWNVKKELEFWSEGADAGLIIEKKDSKKTTTKIETTSLNDYLTCQVDFLKLDIEGAETVVLKDIQPNLGKIKRIFVEYHSFVNQPQSIDEILRILIEAGFRLHINAPGLSSQSPFVKLNTYNNMDMQLNIYGFKEE
ncbi:FkbM family methyltransferase [Salegentibacter holothuriorum]|uniref:FkbM family methyltransferase n=1 Tax=Salegentibacter holothuriorum TaxID=241145 RepID=UPI0015927A23|nr:FkbM family methyltransferase [Salegentibacter holothuriorum]